MKSSFVLALTFVLTSATATLACDGNKSKATGCKKVSMLSKMFHKKAAVEANTGSHGDTTMEVSGTNFIIN